MRAHPSYYCEVYMPTDRLARGPWELEIGWQAPRAAHTATSHHSSNDALARLSPLPTIRAPSDRRIHFVVVFGYL